MTIAEENSRERRPSGKPGSIFYFIPQRPLKLIKIKEYAEESVFEKGKRYDVNFFDLGMVGMKMVVVERDA